MIAHSRAEFLRRTPAETLVDELADFTAVRFSEAGTPVVIAARNEEADLPATLITLADNDRPLHPIVVENGCDAHDRTAEFAARLGATVLHGDRPYKLAALQTGVQFVQDQHGQRTVLFTDADTLVGRSWASSMLARLPSHGETPAGVFGSSVYRHGEKLHVDVARSINGAMKDYIRYLRQELPVCRGHNMLVDFGKAPDFSDAYQLLDHRLFIAEEEAIARTILAAGGTVRSSLGVASVAMTRGDRYSRIFGNLSGRNDMEERAAMYPEYAGIVPYLGQAAA